MSDKKVDDKKMNEEAKVDEAAETNAEQMVCSPEFSEGCIDLDEE